jgi:hypothetical protein
MEYVRYMLEPYPHRYKYELNEVDYQFLQDFNVKLRSKYDYDGVREDDLEVMFEDLDRKCFKEMLVEF